MTTNDLVDPRLQLEQLYSRQKKLRAEMARAADDRAALLQQAGEAIVNGEDPNRLAASLASAREREGMYLEADKRLNAEIEALESRAAVIQAAVNARRLEDLRPKARELDKKLRAILPAAKAILDEMGPVVKEVWECGGGPDDVAPIDNEARYNLALWARVYLEK